MMARILSSDGEKILPIETGRQKISKTAFANLNLIRALSGFVVVFSHFFQLFIMPLVGRTWAINLAMGSAEYAVLTFFALSGFLIALSIQRNILKHGYFKWSEYLISRVARIYPALVASVLLCLILYWISHLPGMNGFGSLSRLSDKYPVSRTAFSLNRFEVFFTLLQTYAFGPGGYIDANGPLWSLSYEVGFYLMAGFLMTLIRGKDVARVFSAVGLVLLALVSIKRGKFLFLHYGTIWVLGVGLFFFIEESIQRAAARTKSVAYYRPIVALFLFLTLTNVLLAFTGFEGPFLRNYFASVAITLILFGISRLNRIISNGFARMADSTYTLYLFHFPCMLFFYSLIRDIYDRSPILYFATAIAFTLGLIPALHFLAKLLENRRLWEDVLIRLTKKPMQQLLYLFNNAG